MNVKILSLYAAALMIAVVSGQRPELPECTIGVDTEACTTAFGHDGYFVHIIKDESFTRPPNAVGGGRGGGGGFRGGAGRGGGGLGLGRGGRPHSLSHSKCVPVDAPEPPSDDEDRGDGFNNSERPTPQIECGCGEDGVCPTTISCDCSCDITLPFGATMQGSKATITKRDGSTITKCVPPIYADADKYTCITDCSVEVDTPFL